MDLNDIVEALIFASPDPITAKDLAKTIRGKVENNPEEGDDVFKDVKSNEVERAITALNKLYEKQGRTFRLIEVRTGWRMYSLPMFAEWIRELFPGQRPTRLSPPALETLAIIAYRQPITKADIEAVRGVSVDGVLQKVIDRGLIRIVGRSETPGKPLLYGTTEIFMEHFGIKEIDELPNASELRTMKLPTAEEQESGEGKEKQMGLGDSGSSETEQAGEGETTGESDNQKEETETSGDAAQEEEPAGDESEAAEAEVPEEAAEFPSAEQTPVDAPANEETAEKPS